MDVLIYCRSPIEAGRGAHNGMQGNAMHMSFVEEGRRDCSPFLK